MGEFDEIIQKEVQGIYKDDYGTFIWTKAGMFMQVPLDVHSDITEEMYEAMRDFLVDAVNEKVKGEYTHSDKIPPGEFKLFGTYFHFLAEDPDKSIIDIFLTRGWGRLQYYENVDPAKLQDAISEWVLDALNSKLKA